MYNLTMSDDFAEEIASNGDIAQALEGIIDLCMADPAALRPGYDHVGLEEALLVVMGGCYSRSSERRPECWTVWPYPEVQRGRIEWIS